MFHRHFYPSPISVVERMIADTKLYRSGRSVLDPSGGKGDILDYVLQRRLDAKYVNQYNRDSYAKEMLKGLYTIEINKDLQKILQGKGYTLLDGNFLTYIPEIKFDLILMNPPFDNAEDHWLKAYDISDGAEVVCVYPTQRLLSPRNTKQEFIVDTIHRFNFGVEDLGAMFKDAERQTDIEVSLIRIPPRERKKLFDFEGSTSGEKLYTFDDMKNNQVAPASVFESLVSRYNRVKQIVSEMHKLQAEAEFYTKEVTQHSISELWKSSSSYDDLIFSIRSEFWSHLFDKTKIASIVTSKVRDDLMADREKFQRMAYTTENLNALAEKLILGYGDIMQSCIDSAFDTMTAFHKDNVQPSERWKHNDAWEVRPLIIVPFGLDTWKYNLDYPHLNYTKMGKVTDIEKALCHMSNKKYEDISENTVYYKILKNKLNFGEWYDSEFFTFKCFKKGTVHLKFKDDKLRQAFNMQAWKGKNWLPADYGRHTV